MTPSEPKCSSERLLDFIQEIEQAQAEKELVAERIRDIYAHADAVGYNKTAIREVIKLRKKDKDRFLDDEAARDIYLRECGMDI